MKRSQLLVILSSLILMFPTLSSAGEVQVEWTNPDDYRDVRAANASKQKFRERTFETLTEHFTELATKLPENYQLTVKVTDVDLAGNVEFGRTQQIRIVRQIHFPSMAFEYQLFDDKKQLVGAQEVNLKDMSFLHGIQTRKGSESLGYEKHMIEQWFNGAFEEYIVKQPS